VPARSPSGVTLSHRALNRALLARQLLLHRADLPAIKAVEHLVGMQAQAPNAPYIGLWTRLAGFHLGHLAELITQRQAVRATLMRGTIHLVTAADYLTLRPVLQPMLSRTFQTIVRGQGHQLGEEEITEILAVASELLHEQPRTPTALRELLAARWAGRDAPAMAALARNLLPLVHVPPKGIWGVSGQVQLTTVDAWLGRDLDRDARPGAMVLRYLAAHGPATVKDIQTWSGLGGLRQVVDRLRPQLRTFSAEDGSELFDVPDGLLPDPGTPVQARLLPEYDNCLRSHADRRRVMTDENRAALFSTKNDAPMPAFLVDGFVRGTWRMTRARKTATVEVRPFAPLSKQDTAAVLAEAEQLLTFAAADAATRDVRMP
jgi:Winged helix DNA-binding domain